MENQEIIQRILRKEITLDEIINNRLAVFTFGKKQPGPDTKIDDGLLDLVIQDLREGEGGKRPAYYDEESDSIKNGFPFRS